MRSRRFGSSWFLAVAVGLAATFAVSDAGAVRSPVMQSLMKKIGALSAGGNMSGTARLLGMVRAMGPEEMPDWGKNADKARAAAARGDRDAMKTACNGCHDQYREAYKSKYGSGGGKGPVPVPVPAP